MKKLDQILMVLSIGSVLFTSCSLPNNKLSRFSKRKYLKKFKPTKGLKEEFVSKKNNQESNHQPTTLLSSKEVDPIIIGAVPTTTEERVELDFRQDQQYASRKNKSLKEETLLVQNKEKNRILNETENVVPKKKMHPWAIATIVFLALMVLTCGLSGILAFFSGFIASRKIRENPTQYCGKWWARVGLIIGWISILTTVVFLGLLVNGAFI